MKIISESGEIRDGEIMPIKRKMRGKFIKLRFSPGIKLGKLGGEHTVEVAIFQVQSGLRYQIDGMSPNDFILLSDWRLV